MPAEPPTALCPICSHPLPAPRPRGRPRVFCGLTCTQRARTRRRRAASLLEYACRQEARAAELAKNTRPYGGNGKWEAEHAGRLREWAAELLEGLPH